jgi:hypothetical protein
MSPMDAEPTGLITLALFVTIGAIVAVLIPFLLGLRSSLRAFSVTRRIDDREIERALRNERGEAGEPVAVQVLRVLRNSLRRPRSWSTRRASTSPTRCGRTTSTRSRCSRTSFRRSASSAP